MWIIARIQNCRILENNKGLSGVEWCSVQAKKLPNGRFSKRNSKNFLKEILRFLKETMRFLNSTITEIKIIYLWKIKHLIWIGMNIMIKLKKYLFRNFNVGTMFKLQWIYNASLCKIGGCTSYDWIMWEQILFYKQWNLEHPNIDIIGWIEKDWISWFVVCVKKSIYGDAQPTTNNRFAPHMFWTQQNYHKILLRAGHQYM